MGLVFRSHIWKESFENHEHLVGENMQVVVIAEEKNTDQVIKGQTLFNQIGICILLLLPVCSLPSL